jgi:hypothetical protein
VRCHGILRVVVGVEAVPGAGEPFDDDLDVVTGPPGHLVADKLGLFPRPGSRTALPSWRSSCQTWSRWPAR